MKRQNIKKGVTISILEFKMNRMMTHAVDFKIRAKIIEKDLDLTFVYKLVSLSAFLFCSD